MQLKKVIEYYGFNTSHITLYQIWESSCNRNTNVSIHLMLLFIGFHWRTVCCKQTVSIHLMLLFINKNYGICWDQEGFNTSHVTLYRASAIK